MFKKTSLLYKFIFAFASIIYSPLVFCTDHVGVVSKFHLNSVVSDRGACIKMEPAIPTTSGWVCIQGSDTNLYSEFTSLLLSAQMSSATCKIRWIVEDESGHGKLVMTECSNG